MDFPFKVGDEYHRRSDLHEQYGGSRQSGISSSRSHDVIFIFTGQSGEQHGYQDTYDPHSGMFLYTGEGQIGDMEFVRGNKAILDHSKNKKHLLLFEQTTRGYCRYLGEYVYVSHHWDERPDTEGNNRRAIIFELGQTALDSLNEYGLVESQEPYLKSPLSPTSPLRELRNAAVTGKTKGTDTRSVQKKIYVRSLAVKMYALARARGICESCQSEAPFINRHKQPFLEVHHLHRVADGGPDDPEGVAAICPNCHREIHFGLDGSSKNDKLIQYVLDIEERLTANLV